MALSGHPADASGDPLVVDAEGCRDLAGIAAVGKVQDDGRSLDMVRRGSARAGERGQGGTGFFRQGQRHRGGFAWHKASSGMVTKRLDRAPSVDRSTRLEMRLAFDQTQGFDQRLALEQTKPLAGVPVPGEVEAIATDVFQAGKWCVEFRFV